MRTEEETAWCKWLFGTLAEGGTWGVPRSGLVFQKRGSDLVLTAVMPYMDEIAEAYRDGKDVPASAEELEAYQDVDFLLIRDRFGKAGITVRKEQ